ncbi:MAG: Type 1 glutamine amidotransferase-like domain-containing protein [Fibrobacteria bacterium]
MRLYLSSYRLGNQPHKLVELVGGAAPVPRVLVIGNACDLLAEEVRKPRIEREFSALENLGFLPVELDLRRYFGKPGNNGAENAATGNPEGELALSAELATASLVWARGGNAFVLLRAMRQSGFAKVLTAALGADSIVYGGYSGGIAVLAPTLRGIETVNDPVSVPAGYDPATPWDGLGLVPYSLAPHFRSAHPASPGIEGVVDYFKARNMPFRTLRDGEAMIVSGDREELAA